MNARTIVAMAAAVLIHLAIGVPAGAQTRSPIIPYQNPVWLTLGGWIGVPKLGMASTESQDVIHTGADFIGSIEVPFAHTWLVRGEAGKSQWDARPSVQGGLQQSEVTLERFTLGVVHNLHPLAPSRVRPYVTGGIGIYRFAGSAEHSRKTGIHGGAGLEFPVGHSPIVFNGEVQVHAYEATGDYVNLATISIGFKVRL